MLGLGVWTLLAVTLSAELWPGWGHSAVQIGKYLVNALPFDGIQFLAAWVSHGTELLYLIPMLAGAYGAGWPLVRWLSRGKGAPMERLAIQLVGGWSFIALIQQALGYAGLLFPLIFHAESALFILSGVVAATHERPWRVARAPAREDRLPAVLTIVLLAFYFLLTRLPGTNEDAMVYHFAAPEHYLQVHKIHIEPQHSQWHFPLACEMIFTIPWHMGGIKLAKLVNLGFLLTGLLLVSCLVKTLRPAGASWWAMFWYASASTVGAMCYQGKNDLGALMFVTAAAWCAVAGIAGTPRWWLGTAWFLGQAVGAKLTAGFFVVGLAATLLVMARPQMTRVRIGLCVVLGTFPLAGWFLENFLFFGNPLFPFASGIFPTLDWGPFYERAFHDYLVIVSPVGLELKRVILTGVLKVFGSTGSPALLAVLPVAFFTARGRPARFLIVSAVLVYGLWLTTERDPRFLLPLIPWAAAMAGHLALEPSIPGYRWLPLGRAALGLTVFVMTYLKITTSLTPAAWLHLLGQRSQTNYMKQHYSTWNHVRLWINEHLSSHDRVLLSGDARRLWFVPRIVSAHPISKPLLWKYSRESATAEEFRKRLRQRGLTHLLHNFVSAEYRGLLWFAGPAWDGRQLALYQEFMRRYARPIYVPSRVDFRNGGFYAYEFMRRPNPEGYPVQFLPYTEALFRTAYSLLAMKRFKQAVAQAHHVARPVQNVLQVQHTLASYHWRAQEYAEAAQWLEPGIRMGFVNANNHVDYGSFLLRDGDFKGAMKMLSRACQIFPTEKTRTLIGHAMIRDGLERLRKKQYASALCNFDQVIHGVCGKANQALAYCYGAHVLIGLGRRDQALSYARHSVELDPNNKEFRTLLREIQTAAGQRGFWRIKN